MPKDWKRLNFFRCSIPQKISIKEFSSKAFPKIFRRHLNASHPWVCSDNGVGKSRRKGAPFSFLGSMLFSSILLSDYINVTAKKVVRRMYEQTSMGNQTTATLPLFSSHENGRNSTRHSSATKLSTGELLLELSSRTLGLRWWQCIKKLWESMVECVLFNFRKSHSIIR